MKTTLRLLLATALIVPTVLYAAAGAWTTAGPVTTDGIQVGSAAFALEAAAPATGYAAGYPGVWKTTNGGTSWVLSSTGITNSTVEALAIDPSNSSVVYAGSYGVFKSTNGGASWSDVSASFGSNMSFVSALAIDPVTAHVYVGFGSGLGVWKSVDGGANWANSNHWGDANGMVPASIKALAIDPRAHLTIYAATELNGVWKSTDGGAKWAAAGLASEGVYALVIDPANSSILYAAGQPSYRATDGTYSVFKSVNGGSSWTAINNGLPGVVGASKNDGRGLSIDASTGAIYLATNGSGVYRSTDGGASWSAFNDGIPAENAVSPTGVREMKAVAAANGMIYAGSLRQIYVYGATGAGQGGLSISGSNYGSSNSFYLNALVNVATGDAGQYGSIYVAAQLPASLGSSWYVHNGSQWTPWSGGALPAYSSGILGNTTVPVLSGLDVRGLEGTNVIVGYGRSESDLLTNQKYAVIHTIR